MSGTITPLEYNCVVRPDPVEEKTKGGLYIPDEVRDRDQAAAEYGTIEAVSPGAFVYEAGGEVIDMRDMAKPGARVAFVRYSGAWLEDHGVRVMKDKDVVAVLEAGNG